MAMCTMTIMNIVPQIPVPLEVLTIDILTAAVVLVNLAL